MDYSRWREVQAKPSPPMDPYAPIYNTHYPHYPHPQHHHFHHLPNPNPDPNPNLRLQNPYSVVKSHETYSFGAEHGLRPPGVDSYAYLNSHPATRVGHEATQPVVTYAHYTLGSASSTMPSDCYQAPSAQSWGAKPIGYAVGLTIPPNGTEQLITANVNSILWTTSTVQAHSSGTRKKGAKKMKIIQSAYCEVCKVDCNSDDILAQHKLGRRHKKNMEKLKDTVAPVPTVEASSDNPVIGPPENPNKGKAVSGKKTKATAESLEDLETKRRRIVECGAAADAVRTCSICNVVCNSETVFNYHLAGQKHAAMVKKHAAGRGVATAT